ncbi:hypothetical protein C8Q76DRAFT_801060 [Earliella scabrosa]|nr:hypothetical protein C8Q76DRAFT_801060 [Earliella scabrosa]
MYVLIGDTIVWWRAWVLWKNNRMVCFLYLALTFAAFVSGFVDTVKTCASPDKNNGLETFANTGNDVFRTKVPSGTSGTLFVGDVAGLVATLLTMVTNVSATMLIGLKALEHWSSVRLYLRPGRARTQAGRVMTLLLESGCMYCVLWITIDEFTN